MCRRTDNSVVSEVAKDEEEMGSTTVVAIIAFCGAVTVASLVAAIMMGNRLADTAVATPAAGASGSQPNIVINTGSGGASTGSAAAVAAMENLFARPPRDGPNECEGKKVQIDNVNCLIDALENVLPQAGGNVTMGFKGEMVVGHEPIKTPYFQNDMCPVNVHWHLGSEHLSVGEFDEMGAGPHTKPGDLRRKLAGGEDVRGGFRCHHYDENDEKFTKEYDWKHCVGMEVGETYEVHWPHSAA
eukprot:CAMPEP_0113627574 /NCGR_PEP_ID=MMETSP0017_2-20120614/14283_1 /TAXON_ID=2856 /ORGANISM="Cylindrotheca closterium" /LENGTH=242 /DNA_ID=CAMNT_0000537839 /DNA_START=56 /DNA_END=780 /DNA_ORIENTATION=+ /assembly_acc=CAM_ASM_000147